ncbi:MAG: YceD family protein [Pseudomonadales bacterium]|nr:YceD family protein [Pseudomonadales bacterium]
MRLEPRQLARDQRDLDVDLSLDDFPRLRDLVIAAEGPVVVRTRFRRDEEGRIRIDGRIGAKLRILCGNCSEPGSFELDVPVALCVVSSDDAARAVGGDVDPLVLTSVEATPAELFEDDLMLALPDRPCRGSLDCPRRPPADATRVDTEDAAPKASPFAVLAALKGEDG